MIILKMHASFGKLNGELSLQDGLNLLCLPNESGKSTWSAFLLAMLYGIDTSEKPSASNNHLPAKERYKPWDGRRMQGRIDLLHNGRYITIERSTQGRVLMGVFRAYDTQSGSPIPELTAENCGKTLCGVEKSVFERTAFIKQLGLSVSADSALEQRMNSLVTTGEEGVSASELLSALHFRQVKLTRSASGRIPKLNQEIYDLQEQLESIREAENEQMQLRAQKDAAQENVRELSALCARIERAKQAQKSTAVEELEEKYARQERICQSLSEQASALPAEAELYRLKQELERTSSTLHTAKLEQAFSPAAPSKPQPPACFVGLDAHQAKAQQQADEALYKRLKNTPAPKMTLCYLALALCVLGGALCLLNLYAGIAVAACALVFFAIAFRCVSAKKREIADAERQAERILGRYGVDEIEKISRLADAYAEQYAAYEAAADAHNAKLDECSRRVDGIVADLERILLAIRAFDPSALTAEGGLAAIQDALQLHSRYASEARALELQRSQLLSARQLFGATAQYAPDPEALTFDEAKITYEKAKAEDELRRLSSDLSEQTGKLSAMGDTATLHSQLEQLREALAEATRQAHIVEIASESLKTADEALRSRFSPQITAEAASILSELTDGKYQNMLLKPNMELSVREQSDAVMHPAAAMSCGAADQMYFALRLAMVHRLLPEDAPILLDDTFVNFDDERTAAALKLLSKENRQIILFSCKEMSYVL